jgi:hypothetical protein
MEKYSLNYHALQGVVRGIALKFRNQLQPSMSLEDIEQELWEKVWRVHKLEEDHPVRGLAFRKLPEIEQIKSCKIFLKRYVIDLVRKSRRGLDSKIDPNRVIEMCGSEEDAFGDMIDIVSAPFKKAESDVEYKELIGLISVWVEGQPEQIQLIMKEKFNPSQDTQAKWEELCEKYPRYKGYESIPGPTLCNLLKVDRSYWYKGIRELQQFLRERDAAPAF